MVTETVEENELPHTVHFIVLMKERLSAVFSDGSVDQLFCSALQQLSVCLHSCLNSVNGFRFSARRPSANTVPTRRVVAYTLAEIRPRGRTEERLSHFPHTPLKSHLLSTEAQTSGSLCRSFLFMLLSASAHT